MTPTHTIIGGIQQMGIGVPNVHEAWAWYRKNFGMDIPVFEEAATAGLMLPYTGGKPQDRHAILALNLQGGGGFEIWQYTSRTPQAANFDIKLGDLGIYACKLKTTDIEKTFREFDKQYIVSKKIQIAPDYKKTFFVKDPYGNLFQFVEEKEVFTSTKANNGGVYGAIIGVSDVDKAILFYSILMEYHSTAFDGEDYFEDLKDLPNGNKRIKRAILHHHRTHAGPFHELLGPTQIELIEVEDYSARKIYENRYWGDLGFIHLCFEIGNIENLKAECEEGGYPFTVDSADSFDMGQAAGRFGYIEDPDGTLIEFVETHKIPILKKLNWYLDLRKRDKLAALPKWMLKSLALNRKK